MNEERRRVLFVDDEPHILDGLRRLLRPMRDEWDMTFVDSGQAALEAFAQDSFDVLVTDMRMPGMDGAELLTRTVEDHPEVVRIVLSGQSDQEALLRSIGPTHQFLSKPCDVDTLVLTVRRAYALRDVLHSPEVQRVVARFGALPSRPSVYTALIGELARPEPSIRRIGELIGADMAMSAKVLQLVNSPFFGVPTAITSVPQAATMLGLDTIRALALSAGAFAQFESAQRDRYLEDVWSRSLLIGSCALAIAEAEGLSDDERVEALTAGLLLDLGKLIFLTRMRSQYLAAVQGIGSSGRSESDAEHDTFGAGHAEAGAYLLGIWGLPDSIVEAVAFHHRPADSPSAIVTPLTAVHVASALTSELLDGGMAGALLDKAYLERLGITDHVDRWRALASGVVESTAA